MAGTGGAGAMDGAGAGAMAAQAIMQSIAIPSCCFWGGGGGW